MTLRKLRLQARYNVLTPAALIGVSSALLLSAAPAFAATQVNNGTTNNFVITAGNSFVNNGTINSLGQAAVTSTGSVGSINNSAGATINGFSYTGILISGNAGAITNDGTISSTAEYGIYIDGNAGSVNNTGDITSYSTAVYINGDVLGAVVNSGTITSDSGYGIYISGDAGSVNNSGTISSTYTGIYIDGDVLGSFANSGSITVYDDAGVEINGDVAGSFTNSGTISGTWAGVAIYGDVTGAFTNSGTISASSGYYGYGVEIDGDAGSFNNSGTITSTSAYYHGYGVYIGDHVTNFTNSGTISVSNVTGSGHTGDGVYIGSGVDSFTNTKSISSTNSYNGYGVHIDGDVGSFTNSGTIASNDHYNSYAVYINGNVQHAFTNSGTISSTSSYYAVGAYINNGIGSFTNSGTISTTDSYYGYGAELYGEVGSFTNSGNIAVSDAYRAYGVYLWGDVNSFTNSGKISATGSQTGYGVYVGGGTVGSFTNSGTIEGSSVGVYMLDSDVTITNAGHIGGGFGAIYFGGENSVLKLLTGGTFGNGVEWDDNTGALFDFSQYHGNLVLEEYGSLPMGNVAPGDNLYLQTSHQVIIVGDSSVTNSSRPVSDITDGINNLINDQLDFGGAGGGGGGGTGALGYAPVRVNSAAEVATAKALAPKVTDGPVWWASATGGGSNNNVDASDVFGALVFGAHAQVQDGLRAGALGSYAHSIARTDNSQTVTSDSGIIGAYGRAELDTVSLDFSLLAGASTNASSRQVSTPGGTETATATFGGWFVNPRVGISMPVLSSDNGDLSVIGTVGYLFGGFGGYTETGSSVNMTVGSQTIGILDAAVGLKGKKELGSNEHGVIIGKGNVEAFAESNVGTSTVPITVLGTTIGNALPPSALALGIRAGLGLEVPLSDNVSFSASGNTSIRTDFTISGAATVKVSGTF